MEILDWLLEWEGIWPARSNCGSWEQNHLVLSVASALTIGIVYHLIPGGLVLHYYRWKNHGRTPTNLSLGVVMFFLFIVSCGWTHLADAHMFEAGRYRLKTFADLCCAMFSVATVIGIYVDPVKDGLQCLKNQKKTYT